MKVALIGGGGREHALAWKIAQSPQLEKLYAFTKNPGIAKYAEIIDIDIKNFEKLSDFLLKNKVDYVMIGPEDPLVSGMVDYLEQKGIKAFGPNKLGAQLEGSKDFTKEVLAAAGAPTAAYKTFCGVAPALEYLKNKNTYPIVLKADGLCAGKGVVIASTYEEAETFVKEIFETKVFGSAGEKLVIEECLEGEEVSIFAITDGKTVKYLSPVQDHKRIFEDDKGPNTGGMGTYAPATLITPSILEEIDQKIIHPVLNTLKERGIIYKGVLFAGIMMTNEGPKVLEFNCRFGDPETQVLMPLLETDFIDILSGVTEGRLHEIKIELSLKKAVCFVAASAGYPGSYLKGKEIYGLDKIHAQVFHAGTEEKNGKILTAGGRVLNVVSLANTVEEAREKALFEIGKISFEGMQFRKDIAMKELTRPKVAVIMGSDSDMPVLSETFKVFESMEVSFKVYVLSAHRTPEEVAQVVKGFSYKGFKVVIAAAGMAAHLPGVVAAYTDLPVLGVPIESKLGGLDALYSIVQMPGGVPVAAMSLGKAGAKNAAIFSLEILGLSDFKISALLKEYKEKQKKAVLEKNKLIQEIGYNKYIESMKI